MFLAEEAIRIGTSVMKEPRMILKNFTYGKGRVRVMRVKRDTARHEVRELDTQVMLEGEFSESFTSSDNSKVIATDTVKNIVNIVARDHPGLESEAFAGAVAGYFLSHYGHVAGVKVITQETKWTRLVVGGAAHDHAFTLDSNGRPTVELSATRAGQKIISGMQNFTFLKSTESGWVGYWMDEATTLKETRDRIFSTAMNARWTWAGAPAGYPEANARILAAMLDVFATTYSPSVQNSLFLMGSAALEAVPEIAEISLACPNKHYIPINMAPFGRDNPNVVFLPTDEPHGQIECTVGRG
jgi:urate oxidase